MDTNPAKFGLALSGAAASSAYYIGFLETLEQHNLKPEVITAQSGASLIVAAYACGTLEKLKKEILTLEESGLRTLLSPSQQNGGLYSLDRFEEYFRETYTDGMNFEDLPQRLAFVATDLETGSEVSLCTGDIARACRITCTLPGVFEPYQWGNKRLVDGGLSNVIPSDSARLLGAEAVLGINLGATKHIFLPSHLLLRKVWKIVSLPLLITRPTRALAKHMRHLLSSNWLNSLDEADIPLHENMFTVLGRSMDIAIASGRRSEQLEQTKHGCDILIFEQLGGHRTSVKSSRIHALYQQGRTAAKQKLPHIHALLNKKSQEMNGKTIPEPLQP